MSTPDQLACQYQAGDPAALVPLHALLQPLLQAAVGRACAKGLPAALEPADLHQQGWLLLADLTARWEPRPGVCFAAYVGRLFPWALARFLRAQEPARRSRRHRAYSWSHERTVQAQDEVPDDSAATWDDRLYCAELLRAVEPRTRQALWLHVVECRPFTEVASALGVPRATAFDLCRRGLAQMRRAA